MLLLPLSELGNDRFSQSECFGFLHVTCRGNEQQAVFRDDADLVCFEPAGRLVRKLSCDLTCGFVNGRSLSSGDLCNEMQLWEGGFRNWKKRSITQE